MEIAVQYFYLKVICTNLYITFDNKVDSVSFWCCMLFLVSKEINTDK